MIRWYDKYHGLHHGGIDVSKPAAGTQSVILSKTATPLQRMPEMEKQKDKEIKEKSGRIANETCLPYMCLCR
jgi:hypothetical protein